MIYDLSLKDYRTLIALWDGAKIDNFFRGDQHTIVNFAQEQKATEITLDLKVHYFLYLQCQLEVTQPHYITQTRSYKTNLEGCD